MIKGISIAAVIASLIISGCVSQQPEITPAPTATPAPTPVATPGPDVVVLNAPATAEAGRSFEISWRVNSPVEKNINHTAVHYGPESKSEPLTLQSYPNLTKLQSGKIPADFSANLTINITGTTYFRAHAMIDGKDYWSSEKTVTVSSPQASITPAIKIISPPGSVNGETYYTILWEVSGGTQGDISQTAIYWGYKSGSANISDYFNPTKSLCSR